MFVLDIAWFGILHVYYLDRDFMLKSPWHEC